MIRRIYLQGKYRMKLILIRHGESHWNVEHRHQGQLDSGLTDEGLAQAVESASLLAKEVPQPDAVWSSDLPRARDTAEEYAKLLGAHVGEDPRLREIDIGSWAGLLVSDARKKYPDVVAAAAEGEDPRRGGGETYAEMRARAVSFFRDMMVQGHSTVVVFTHGGLIQVAGAYAAGVVSPGHLGMFPPDNCSRTVLELSGDQRRLVRFNVPFRTPLSFHR